MSGKSLIYVAVVTSAHGIRGEVKIRSFAEPPEAIFSYPLTDVSGKRHFKLSHPKKGKGDILIASIEGIDNRNAAESLKGMELFASASVLPQKNQLIGLEARLADGRAYGRITQLYNFGAGDIIEILFSNGKTEMLPLNESFVGDIHAAKGYVIVFPPDYVEGKE